MKFKDDWNRKEEHFRVVQEQLIVAEKWYPFPKHVGYKLIINEKNGVKGKDLSEKHARELFDKGYFDRLIRRWERNNKPQ